LNKTLVIYGAGGHGKSVLDVAFACGIERFRILDDRPGPSDLLNWPVELASGFSAQHALPFEFIIAIGDNAIRRRCFDRLMAAGGIPIALVHPRACVSSFARIGPGSVIFGGVVINADARIGLNCIINTQSGIDHDTVVSDHAHIGPAAGLAGGVHVGCAAMIGMGARLLPGIEVGDEAVIGAGAVVCDNIPAHARAYGIPARVRTTV
jgi:sugar O-acyltransferase (sialic acid O-acetyltransferase NeuD family)